MTHPLVQPLALPCGVTLSNRLPSFEKNFDIFHLMPWNYMQLERMGNGLEPDLAMTGEAAFAAFAEREGRNLTALLDHRRRRAA
jgi:hypothetical protein